MFVCGCLPHASSYLLDCLLCDLHVNCYVFCQQCLPFWVASLLFFVGCLHMNVYISGTLMFLSRSPVNPFVVLACLHDPLIIVSPFGPSRNEMNECLFILFDTQLSCMWNVLICTCQIWIDSRLLFHHFCVLICICVCNWCRWRAPLLSLHNKDGVRMCGEQPRYARKGGDLGVSVRWCAVAIPWMTYPLLYENKCKTNSFTLCLLTRG